jgi:hypothetical protein
MTPVSLCRVTHLVTRHSILRTIQQHCLVVQPKRSASTRLPTQQAQGQSSLTAAQTVARDIPSWSIWFSHRYGDPQAELAAQFYQDVKALPDTAITALTGHSLGGALAGFVGSIYGLAATPINNIDFLGAANALYGAVTTRNQKVAAANYAEQKLYYPSGVIPPVTTSGVHPLQVPGNAAIYTTGFYKTIATPPVTGLDPHTTTQVITGSNVDLRRPV